MPIHSSVAKAPAATITRLASHGVSLPRTQALSLAAAPADEPAAAAGSLPAASPLREYPATAVTAATSPANVAGDPLPDPPKPKNRAIVPSAPVLWSSHAISGGAASMSSARPAVTAAAQPTQRARRAPRPGPPVPSVAHQRTNSAIVTAAAIAGASHQVQPVTEADAWPPDQASTPRPRSSQPQAWLRA